MMSLMVLINICIIVKIHFHFQSFSILFHVQTAPNNFTKNPLFQLDNPRLIHTKIRYSIYIHYSMTNLFDDNFLTNDLNFPAFPESNELPFDHPLDMFPLPLCLCINCTSRKIEHRRPHPISSNRSGAGKAQKLQVKIKRVKRELVPKCNTYILSPIS